MVVTCTEAVCPAAVTKLAALSTSTMLTAGTLEERPSDAWWVPASVSAARIGSGDATSSVIACWGGRFDSGLGGRRGGDWLGDGRFGNDWLQFFSGDNRFSGGVLGLPVEVSESQSSSGDVSLGCSLP